MDIKKVIAIVNPESEAQPALEKVLKLAKVIDFDLKLIACDYTQYLVEGYYFDAIDITKMRAEYLEERHVALEAIAAPLRDEGLNVECEAFWAHPAYETVVSEVESFSADLVVSHTRRHGALSRMFLSNDDWQLVRQCPVPLLLVKEKPWDDHPAFLAAVDPMHARHKPDGLDHKILRIAGDLAKRTDGKIYAFHSYSQIALSGTYPEQAKIEHKEAFDRLVAEFDLPEEQQYLTEDSPEFAMGQLEKDLGIAVIVMGGVSRSILSDIFIGNTTEKILDYLESDILIVKPDGFPAS